MLRVLAQANALTSLALGKEAAIGKFADPSAAGRLKRRWAGRVRIVDEDTLHVVLSPAEAAPRKLVPLLKRILGAEPERSRSRGRS